MSDWLDDLMASNAPPPTPKPKPRKKGGEGVLVVCAPLSPEELRRKYGGALELPKVTFTEILDDGTVVEEMGKHWPANYRGLKHDQ
jgi:hypothetical protein